jgi:hypothetical protein
MENNSDKSIGPIVGTLVIVIVLFVAAIYVFASHVNKQAAIDATMVNSTTTLPTEIITNSADDVQSLKADLNNSVK